MFRLKSIIWKSINFFSYLASVIRIYKENMKRLSIRIIFIFVMLIASCNAGTGTGMAMAGGGIPSEGASEGSNVQSGKLLALINDYRDKEGFEVISVGSLGTSIIKKMIVNNLDKVDEKTRSLFKAIDGIKKIAIVDFGSSDAAVRTEFIHKMEKLLSRSQLLMEIKDSENKMYMYGVVGRKNNKVGDFVLYNPDGGNVICLFGSISLDTLMNLADK